MKAASKPRTTARQTTSTAFTCRSSTASMSSPLTSINIASGVGLLELLLTLPALKAPFTMTLERLLEPFR